MTPIDGLKTADSWLEFLKYFILSYFYLWKTCTVELFSGQHITKNIAILFILFIILFFAVLRPVFLLYVHFDSNNRNYDKRMKKSKKAQKKIDKYSEKHEKEHSKKGLTDGVIGENECYKVLSSKFKKNNVFRSVYIYNNKKSQINECDLVVVTTKAVYVVEVKNYGMYVVPNTKTNWQCFPIDAFNYPFNKDGSLASSREYTLDNDKWVRSPMKQCERHIELFNIATNNLYESVPIVPIVAFSDRATIIWKNEAKSLKKYVTTTSNVTKIISSIDKEFSVASENKLNEIRNFLNAHTKENTDPDIIIRHLNLAMEMEGK